MERHIPLPPSGTTSAMTSDNESALVSIRYTSEFKRNRRQLGRKYRRIKADIQPLLDALVQGQTPGNQVPNVQFEVFKARVSNSDAGKGKSGGYRVIYHQAVAADIILVTIYAKTEQGDISPQDIRAIIIDF